MEYKTEMGYTVTQAMIDSIKKVIQESTGQQLTDKEVLRFIDIFKAGQE